MIRNGASRPIECLVSSVFSAYNEARCPELQGPRPRSALASSLVRRLLARVAQLLVLSVVHLCDLRQSASYLLSSQLAVPGPIPHLGPDILFARCCLHTDRPHFMQEDPPEMDPHTSSIGGNFGQVQPREQVVASMILILTAFLWLA